MEFINEELEDYIGAHTHSESALLEALNRETQAKILRPRMLSGHVQGQFLSLISKLLQPRNILEIGTYTGYASLCLVEGLQNNGKLITIDINEELEDFAKSYFKKHPKGDQIDMQIGDALKIIPSLNMPFDLVFIDADKENYLKYYELLIDTLPKGALIIADNVLWSGKVIEPLKKGDIETTEILNFNAFIQNDSRVENVLLGIRDGLMMIRKI